MTHRSPDDDEFTHAHRFPVIGALLAAIVIANVTSVIGMLLAA